MLIDDLKALLGEDKANDFIAAFGGQKLWISSPTPGKKVGQNRAKVIGVLGEEAADELFRTYGGAWIMVPTDRQIDVVAARRRVAEMQRAGMSINEMAAAVKRGRRTIFRWLNLPHTKIKRG